MGRRVTFDASIEFEPTVENLHRWADLANMLMERAFEGGVRVVPRETALPLTRTRAWALHRQRRVEGWCTDRASCNHCLDVLTQRLDENRVYRGGAVR